MGVIEDTIMKFGFTKYSTVVAIVCLLALLGNFLGGMMANIIVAHGGPIADRKLTEKTSFRLALVFELMLILYAVYYHAILVSSLNTAQAILWIFTFLAAPLLAALGAQVAYLVFKSKIDERKKENRQREREERSARMAEQNGE